MSGGHGHDAHAKDAHPEGDDEAHGAGHGDDPNAGVVLGDPPTPAWVLTAAGIALVTAIAAVLLAIAMRDVPVSTPLDDHGGGSATPTATAEGH